MTTWHSDLLLVAKEVLNALLKYDQTAPRQLDKFLIDHSGFKVEVDIPQLLKVLLSHEVEKSNDASQEAQQHLSDDDLKNYVDTLIANAFIDSPFPNMSIAGVAGVLMIMSRDGKLHPICIDQIFAENEYVMEDEHLYPPQHALVQADLVDAASTVQLIGDEQNVKIEDVQDFVEDCGEQSVYPVQGVAEDSSLQTGEVMKTEPHENEAISHVPLTPAKPQKKRSAAKRSKVVVVKPDVDEWAEADVLDEEDFQANGKRKKARLKGKDGWVCSVCNAELQDKAEYNAHLKSHPEVYGYWCEICDKVYQKKAYYESHWKEHGGKKTEKRYPCPRCDMVFEKSVSRCAHMVKVHNDSMRMYNKRMEEKGVEEEFNEEVVEKEEEAGVKLVGGRFKKRRKFICKVCGKMLMHNGSLKMHMKLHRGEYPYRCQHCNHGCQSMIALNSHMRSKHMRLDYRYCRICLTEFPTVKEKMAHMTEHHSKAFLCEQCGKNFTTKNGYRKHTCQPHKRGRKKKERKATEKVSCPHCGKIVFKNYLKMHVKVVHGEYKGPFVCSMCGAVYRTEHHYNLHVEQHKGNKILRCEICEKDFRSRPGYRDHMNMHNGVKPYKCEFCQAEFSHKTSWREHSLTHVYQPQQEICQECGTVFSSLKSLRKHCLKIHKMQAFGGYGYGRIDAQASGITAGGVIAEEVVGNRIEEIHVLEEGEIYGPEHIIVEILSS